MKIYDISQEVFSCVVFPGDPAPVKKETNRMSRGDLYNLTEISMCAHNGTHLDAPFHFLENGDTVDAIPLHKTVGDCFVTQEDAELTAERAEAILREAQAAKAGCEQRILIRGRGVVTEAAARVFAAAGICLIGVESQTVGPEDGPMAVHKILLPEKVVLLEGLRLGEAEPGVYFLCAQPINLGGCDGAPCRAILLGDECF